MPPCWADFTRTPNTARHDGETKMALCARNTVQHSKACCKSITDDDGDNRLPEGHACGNQSRTGLVCAHVQIDTEPELDELECACI